MFFSSSFSCDLDRLENVWSCLTQPFIKVVVVFVSLRTACSNKFYYSSVLCLGAKQSTASPFLVSFYETPEKFWAARERGLLLEGRIGHRAYLYLVSSHANYRNIYVFT